MKPPTISLESAKKCAAGDDALDQRAHVRREKTRRGCERGGAAMTGLVSIAIAFALGCSPGIVVTDRWHRATLVASSALIVCDWGMTRWMPKSGAYERGYVELNPLLGRTPSAHTIDTVFFVALFAHVVAYPFLPRWARAWWYTTVTALELANVAYFKPSGVCGDFGTIGGGS